MVRRTCRAVASYLGFGTLCGSLGAHCFIFSALVPVSVRTNTQTYSIVKPIVAFFIITERENRC
jgi:hypothetical protein